MGNQLNRRSFIKSGVTLCAGCALACGSTSLAATSLKLFDDKKDIIDPLKFEFCGHICRSDCQMKVASETNNIELKKQVFEAWKIGERFGIEFDPNDIYCTGCRNVQEPYGAIIKHCAVRKCVVEKELECCIQCRELALCEKELWVNYPDFHKSVIEVQKEYFNQLEAKS